MCSSSQLVCQRLDSLQADLARLKGELAEAWASSDSTKRVPGIECRIRQVWEQMDYLAVSLSEPDAVVSPVLPKSAC